MEVLLLLTPLSSFNAPSVGRKEPRRDEVAPGDRRQDLGNISNDRLQRIRHHTPCHRNGDVI